MNSIFILSILVLVSFLLQALLGFRQMQHFGNEYTKMRKEGRVAIGRRPGKFTSGTIIMFSLDDKGIIRRGRLLQGTTILARFKDYNKLNSLNIGDIDTNFKIVKKEMKITRRAIMDAVNNYQLVISGKEIPEKKSTLNKLLSSIKRT